MAAEDPQNTLEQAAATADAEAMDEDLGADILKASSEEITNRTRLLENDIKV